MASDTRLQFLDKAEALFAARGFYGVSIAAVADELRLTKQALLHHFGSKERLYGEVLKRISDRFEKLSAEVEGGDEAADVKLKSYLLQLHAAAGDYPDQTRLLMRELLDNNARAETAGAWYLKAFLERLILMVQAVPNWRSASDAEALSFVYQILGALNYFGVSEPTLTGIFGADAYRALAQAFPSQLTALIDAGLKARV